jgi:spore germination cell wall hydrolase CwlJ-like protein
MKAIKVMKITKLGIAGILFALCSLQNVSANTNPSKKPANPQVHYTKEKMCIVDALYHEARGEGKFGMKAVANVIYNRYKHSKYPNSFCAVIMQPKQFSFTLENKLIGYKLKKLHKDKKQYLLAEQIADQLLNNNFNSFLPENTLYYATVNVKNYWTKKKNFVAQIGNHKFYALKEKT